MPKPGKRVLLTGATGFVGSHLHPVLVRAGYEVCGATRNPAKARRRKPQFEFCQLEMSDPKSIAAALAGRDAAIYLVHGMAESESEQDYEAAEQRMAANFLAAAEQAGVTRIVYLGGVRPAGRPSKHLRSRLATGETLRSGSVSTIELQAGMIIGRGSQSWRIVRDLSMRLPVMVLPRWLRHRSQPIAIEDVSAALRLAVDLDLSGSAVYPLPGPETLSAREILERVARLRNICPRVVEVPVVTPRLSSYWIALVTRADRHLAAELVEGLTSDLVAKDEGFWALAPEHELVPFDVAAERALAAENRELSIVARASERIIQVLARPSRH
ncbi:NAD(P)H-binding protein [Enhygromyxa salina]|uniref:3 beta-hydroxysteroid dehydrogenase/Delta 5-->4-isomerase n=1 Tax=Enhygromyxa salina TaxID=215803 RepID=A0A2S9XTE7_9BACT|nr:NAD(P)H-binding protein [Enhygromyxa salina]PRP96132.1 3 beta-hydroxysteroid dehydrogenase/Delta 5-->4-isomerase [Enhygromyxa salina]